MVKDYEWGIRGLDSRVARYALESGSIEGVDPSSPYAELWIGTHPSVSFLASSKRAREEKVDWHFLYEFRRRKEVVQLSIVLLVSMVWPVNLLISTPRTPASRFYSRPFFPRSRARRNFLTGASYPRPAASSRFFLKF